MIQRLHARQQIESQHRRDGHGHNQRGERGHDERHAQRDKQPPLHARQGEQRHKHQHNDHGRIENRRAHLHRGVRDDFQWMQPVFRMPGAIRLQAPHDVFHAHHRVVHQSADGDGQTAERHGVDRHAEVLENQCGDENGNGYGRKCDERGAQRAEKYKQDHRDKHRSADQLALQRADGGLDKARLAKGHAGRLHAGGQASFHVLERGLDPESQRDGVGGGLFLDAQNHCGLAFKPGITALGRGGKRNVRDLPQ